MTPQLLTLIVTVLIGGALVPVIQHLKKRLKWTDNMVYFLLAVMSVLAGAGFLYLRGMLDASNVGGVLQTAALVMVIAASLYRFLVRPFDGQHAPDWFPTTEWLLKLLAMLFGVEIKIPEPPARKRIMNRFYDD